MGRPLDPQTRMLLASDGSTTTLLEALLGDRVHLRLDEVSRRTGADVPAETRSALGIGSGTPVVVRRSALVTRSGLVVSRNNVVAWVHGAGLVGQIMTTNVPIGLTMNAARAGHYRILLASGWAAWDDADPAVPCAFKAYVIVHEGRRAIHIVERFNPEIVPTDGYDATEFAGRDGDGDAMAEAV
jgi:chorismate-pyruvate lyase